MISNSGARKPPPSPSRPRAGPAAARPAAPCVAPPATVWVGDDPRPGPPARAELTYGGWPLYYFEKDRGSGTARGQDVHGFGAEWYLVTPSGEVLHGE